MFLPQRREQRLFAFDFVGKFFERRRDFLHLVAVEDDPAAAYIGERRLEFRQHRQFVGGEEVVAKGHGPIDIEHVGEMQLAARSEGIPIVKGRAHREARAVGYLPPGRGELYLYALIHYRGQVILQKVE